MWTPTIDGTGLLGLNAAYASAEIPKDARGSWALSSVLTDNRSREKGRPNGRSIVLWIDFYLEGTFYYGYTTSVTSKLKSVQELIATGLPFAF